MLKPHQLDMLGFPVQLVVSAVLASEWDCIVCTSSHASIDTFHLWTTGYGVRLLC